MPYLPALASIIAVIGILFVFKKTLEKIKEQPDQLEKFQTQLFIGVAISEAIPIILIIMTFINMETVLSITELYVPATIIIALMVFGVFYIFTQVRIDVDEKVKPVLRSFGFIGMGLVNAIPIISLVTIFMMAP